MFLFVVLKAIDIPNYFTAYLYQKNKLIFRKYNKYKTFILKQSFKTFIELVIINNVSSSQQSIFCITLVSCIIHQIW